MAVDIRANVTCNLGRLISASISDDYLQGSGLIKCSGSCEVVGNITPATGSTVVFQYTKKGITRTVPRKLRVLSSFADPFRRTTKVQLGCKLTYLQDLTDPINWQALDDPENDDFDEEDQKIIVVPINASSIANKCLQELGISASSMPLTSKFSVAEFDFSPGYVSILGDLLVSESYCGYLDTTETLQIFSLNQSDGAAPVLTSDDLIDISEIGVGQLPGEGVTVSYSTLKLRDPEDDDQVRINWEEEEVYGARQEVTIDTTYTAVTPGLGSTEKRFNETYSFIPYSKTVSSYDKWNRLLVRTTLEKTILAAANADYIVQALQSGNVTAAAMAPANARRELSKITETVYSYKLDPVGNILIEGYDEVESEETTTWEPEVMALAGSGIQLGYKSAGVSLFHALSLGFPFNIGSATGRSTGRNYSPLLITETVFTRFESAERQVTVYSRDPDSSEKSELGSIPVTKTTTFFKRIYARTQRGQQYLSSAIQPTDEGTGIASPFLLTQEASVLVDDGFERRIFSGREVALQSKPGDADAAIANNGFTVESSSELVLALGSATAQRRIEFSMPYAPDDAFIKSGLGYRSVPSDAEQKAANFGRIQNRLLLGNRGGMNIQVSPERLPHAPFSAIIINANGIAAKYRVNGTSWTMDSTGILVSTDALYWGAVGTL